MKVFAYIGAAISFIIAAIVIVFGFLYILGAFSPQGESSWLINGLVMVVIGFVLVAFGIALIYFTKRSEKKQLAAAAGSNVTYKVELPGNVSMDTIKCKSCGGSLTSNDIKMVAGAPVVTCPFCNTTYQLTEEPKW
jgi:uncharacterized membrane protein